MLLREAELALEEGPRSVEDAPGNRRPGLVRRLRVEPAARAVRLLPRPAGGRRGARRTYVGCRDRTPARGATSALQPARRLTFAGAPRSGAGGLAFYDPAADGELAARAYLITFGQFSDVVAQEARAPGRAADLVLGDPEHDRRGRRRPVSTRRSCTSTTARAPRCSRSPRCRTSTPQPPSAAYLRTMLDGLDEAFTWTRRRAGGLPAARAGGRPAGGLGSPTCRPSS